MEHDPLFQRTLHDVGALEIDGVFNSLGQWMIHMTDGNFALTMMIILWGSAILSAVIDNIPLVISMIPLIQSIVPIFAGQMGIAGSEELITAQIRERLFWALALGACLGGNGTLIGASANVVVCQIARKNPLSGHLLAIHPLRVPADDSFGGDLLGLSVFQIYFLTVHDGRVLLFSPSGCKVIGRKVFCWPCIHFLQNCREIRGRPSR